MAFTFYFRSASMTSSQYQAVTDKLEATGYGAPKGRLIHVCFGDPNKLQVLDVWNSMENFEEFGKVLMPMLQEAGVEAGQPEINRVENIIETPIPA